MAIHFDTVTEEYLQIDQNLINTDVFTWACWAWFDSSTSDRVLLWSGDSTAANKYFLLVHEADDDSIQFKARNTATKTAATSTAITDGQWHHILAYSASATDRKVYIDNAGEGVNVDSVTGIDSITDRFTVGRTGDNTPVNEMDGRIAEIAIWNFAMTDSADRQMLVDRFSPIFVKPNNLILYFPCLSILDLKDRLNPTILTAFATPTDAEHPIITRPSAQIIQFPVVVGGGGGPTALQMQAYQGMERMSGGFRK